MDVVLRPVVAEDLPLLAVGEAPYDDFGPRVPRTEPYSPELREFGGMAVCDTGGLLLGSVSWIWQQWGPMPESRNPMIGIGLRPEARGRGVGTAAQRALVDLFFRHTNVNRVEACTDVGLLPDKCSSKSFTR